LLQNPYHVSGDILKNVRRETGRIFRNKGQFIPEKNNVFERKRENININDLHKGIAKFGNYYQARADLVT
jgi:nucleosome binding factor SPN SPT16 subunit